jgi:hypothetical protein
MTLNNNSKPKYVISGNSMAEVVQALAELVYLDDQQHIEVIKAQKGDSTYGKWNYTLTNDENEKSRLNFNGSHMPVELSRGLDFGQEFPSALGITIAFRKLVPASEIGVQRVATKAATASRRLGTLRDRIAALDTKKS